MSEKIETVFDDVCKVLLQLKMRPAMFVPPDNGVITYFAVSTYLMGAFLALSICTGREIHNEISCWFGEKIGTESRSVGFMRQVKSYYKKNTDAELIDILIDLIVEFLKQCGGNEHE